MAGPDVRQCRDCGKLFQYYGNAYCRDCLNKMDEYYTKVRDYIYEHPTANITIVSEETEVETKYIQQFLHEGRLQFATPEASGLACRSCGAPVGSGSYCEACKAKMAQALNSTLPQREAPPPQKRMGPSKESKGMHVDLNKRER